MIRLHKEGRNGGDAVGFEEGEGRGGGEDGGELELDEVIMNFEGGVDVHCTLGVELQFVVEGAAADASVSEEAHEDEVVDHGRDDEVRPLLESGVEEGVEKFVQ